NGSSSSSAVAPDDGRLKKLRRGGGIGVFAPRIDRHRISFSRASGARSSIVKSIASDWADPNDEGRLRSVSETVGSPWRHGRTVPRFGVPVTALYIDVAAASYWLIGGRPRISSIVRSTPDVV